MRSLFLHYCIRLKVLETRGPGEVTPANGILLYIFRPFLSVNYTNTNVYNTRSRVCVCVCGVIAV